jgi:hypothetical protein
MTLTNPKSGGMISMLSQKTKAGIGVLNVAAQPQTCGFFVSKAQLSIMAGWAGQPKGWPVATPVRQLRSVRLPMIGVVWRRVYNLIRVAIMKNHVQPTAKSSQTKQSRSNLINSTHEGKCLDDLMTRQDRECGIKPLPLDHELLLKRIAQGGHSGQFLADAFISAYRTNQSFQHSLGELVRLDSEAFRLFHQILHIRHVPGWSDQLLYDIEFQVKTLMTKED